jgi:hypothetical protein
MSSCQLVSLPRPAFAIHHTQVPSIGHHYLATLTADIYAEPMASLVQHARNAIADLARQAQTGGQAQKRFQPSAMSHAAGKRTRASP